MITMHAWMFLSTYEKLREKIQHMNIINMSHLGTRAFEEIGGEIVSTTSFVIRKIELPKYKGVYCRLVEPSSQQGKEDAFLNGSHRYIAQQSNYSSIPGAPVAYWVSKKVLSLFARGLAVSHYVSTRDGLTTSDNDRYIRYFWEIAYNKIFFAAHNEHEFWVSRKKFAPLIKGGQFRKWSGNTWFVITFDKESRDILATVGNHLPSEEIYFSPYLTWNRISTNMGFRYVDSGFMFESASLVAIGTREDLLFTLAFSNTSLARYEMELINPTTNMLTGYVNQLRIPDLPEHGKVVSLSEDCVRLSSIDWDSFETSWDFQQHPLVRHKPAGLHEMRVYGAPGSGFEVGQEIHAGTIEQAYMAWWHEADERFAQMKANEEELNRIFIGIYGLQDELTPDVNDTDVTVRKADLGRDIRSLISYAVGCMLGRYSLDKPGLAFAGGAWNESQYVTYAPRPRRRRSGLLQGSCPA